MANARAAYDTSVVARRLQEPELHGTRRKYELGTATILDVVIGQRDATTRELRRGRPQPVHSCAHQPGECARHVFEDYDIHIDEAKNGVVTRPPDMIPAVPPGGGNAPAPVAPAAPAAVLKR